MPMSPTSRRNFLKFGAMSGLAAPFILQSGLSAFGQISERPARRPLNHERKERFEIPYEAKTERLFYYTRATFEPHLNTDFRVTVGPYRVVNLELVKVSDRTARPRKGSETSGECFSLLFKASGKLSDLQQTYVLEHGALGKFSLFLTSASDQEKERDIYYEAIINHVNQ